MTGWAHGLAVAILGLATSAAAAQVAPVDYDDLARALDGRIHFETLPRRAEPGFDLKAAIREPGATLGERFAGQQVAGDPFDRLSGAPEPPLATIAGTPGRNLSVALHRGFGSNALFPLGPRGFPATDARGEGSLAVLFDRNQAAFGLRVHSDYPSPLGQAPEPGHVTLRLYTRSGALIAEYRQRLGPGITAIGLRRDPPRADIAGFTVVNDDPGGIAIDDILFQLVALTG